MTGQGASCEPCTRLHCFPTCAIRAAANLGRSDDTLLAAPHTSHNHSLCSTATLRFLCDLALLLLDFDTVLSSHRSCCPAYVSGGLFTLPDKLCFTSHDCANPLPDDNNTSTIAKSSAVYPILACIRPSCCLLHPVPTSLIRSQFNSGVVSSSLFSYPIDHCFYTSKSLTA